MGCVIRLIKMKKLFERLKEYQREKDPFNEVPEGLITLIGIILISLIFLRC
jgi:hypothetical protein